MDIDTEEVPPWALYYLYNMETTRWFVCSKLRHISQVTHPVMDTHVPDMAGGES